MILITKTIGNRWNRTTLTSAKGKNKSKLVNSQWHTISTKVIGNDEYYALMEEIWLETDQ